MISKESIKRLKQREDRKKEIKKKEDQIKKEVFFALYHKICPYCAEKLKISKWYFNKPKVVCSNCEIKFETILRGIDSASLDCIYHYNDCKIINIKGVNNHRLFKVKNENRKIL